eukprot:g42285.t1
MPNNEGSKYRRLIEGLVTWCNENDLSLNVRKSKKVIIDLRKKRREHIYINGIEAERVESTKFQGVVITNNLSWTGHVVATVRKTKQRLFFLRWLRKFGMSIRTLTKFYRCTIESLLFKCVTTWNGNWYAQD